MHRYRHDVKVGPEIVIPEGYPGKFFSGTWISSLDAERCIEDIIQVEKINRIFDIIIPGGGLFQKAIWCAIN